MLRGRLFYYEAHFSLFYDTPVFLVVWTADNSHILSTVQNNSKDLIPHPTRNRSQPAALVQAGIPLGLIAVVFHKDIRVPRAWEWHSILGHYKRSEFDLSTITFKI